VSELKKEYQRGYEAGEHQKSYLAQRTEDELKKMREKVNLFEKISGVKVLSDRYGYDGRVRSEAAQIRAIMASETGSYFERMSKLVLQMETLSRQVRETLVKEGTLPEKPNLSDPCPHPVRHGRHELYVDFPSMRKRGRKKDDPLLGFCRACGAEGEVS
jgi:hypothetical protein